MTADLFVATVPDSLAGVRVDRAVSMLTGVSRSAAARLVDLGEVVLDGEVVIDRAAPLRAGSSISVSLASAGDVLAADERVEFRVVFADDALVVVDKPAGVVVHPGAGRSDGTLVAGLLARFPDIGALAGGVCDPARPGIVHRSDKGTSGLLVVARTPDAYRALASQMQARTVGREYVALVRGAVPDDRGIVDAPVGRSTRTPTKMAVSAGGRPARTRYEVDARAERVWREAPGEWIELPVTLVRCVLETGRTHQIRVHMAAIGHPVVGDDRYGRDRARERGLLVPGRLFLHAASIAVDHPVTGERLTWRSPLPEDLRQVLDGPRARGTR